MFCVVRNSSVRQIRSQLRMSRSLSAQQHSLLTRLLSTLAVLEQRDGKLNISSLGAVTAAQKLGGSITGFLAGSGLRGVAEEAARVEGVEKIIMVENPDYEKVS